MSDNHFIAKPNLHWRISGSVKKGTAVNSDGLAGIRMSLS